MAKIDLEDLLDTVEQKLKQNLNAKINEIETQKTAKGKGLKPPLAEVKEASYYRQSWNEKILTSYPAVFYGVDAVSTEDGGDAVAKTYVIFVEIILVDSSQSKDGHKRVSRYSRAIEEVVLETFGNLNGASKVKVSEIVPLAFLSSVNTSEEVKVGGVHITTSLF